MVDTIRIFEDLRSEIGESAARKVAEILGKLYEEIQESVEREEFRKLREEITRLASAQRESEEKLSRLEDAVRELALAQKELAEAQKRSEERITRLEDAVRELALAQKELAEAQKRSEERITRLEDAVRELALAQKELAEAQKRSEERITRLEDAVRELAEAQRKLAEAQRRTEQELHQLAREHRETRRQLGGLAMTVGYILEDRAIAALPKLLKRDYGIVVEGRLKRGHVIDREGKYVEVNIIGKGLRDGKRVVIIGEGKSQLSRKKIDDFTKKKLKMLEGVFSEEIFPILVTYMITEPNIEDYARERGIAIYYSFDFVEQF